jgi:hypothetical protein
MINLRCLLGSLHNEFRPKEIGQTIHKETGLGEDGTSSAVYRLQNLQEGEIWIFVGIETPTGWVR